MSEGPVHTAPFLCKKREINRGFSESVHTDSHKKATKTDVFENAIESGCPQITEDFKKSPIFQQ